MSMGTLRCSTPQWTRCYRAATTRRRGRMSKARYIMIGGFLGAGKTTAILQLAQDLHRKGTRVGLITNDQSFGLVDTALLSSQGLPVEEITGGCFCCRFQSLMDAAAKPHETAGPTVWLA